MAQAPRSEAERKAKRSEAGVNGPQSHKNLTVDTSLNRMSGEDTLHRAAMVCNTEQARGKRGRVFLRGGGIDWWAYHVTRGFDMIFAAILLGLCQIASTCLVVLLFRKWANSKQAEIEQRLEDAIRDWATSPEEGKPSKLAIALDQVGIIVGSAAARSIMGNLKQDSSSIAHVANGISDQIVAQQNPIMALISGGKKGKNSALLRLAELLGPMLTKGASSSGDGSKGSNTKSFTL